MRPRLLTAQNFALLALAVAIFGGLAFWLKSGMPLPGTGVASTAGKIAFVSDRGGHNDLWMMNGDGAEPVALTNDAADDRAPVWSGNGSEIAFVSENRLGVTPQIFLMDAAPGAKAIPMTHTSSSKDSPVFAGDRLYYLDAGKLVSTDKDGTDTTAILPDHEMRENKDLGEIFAVGGFSQASPAPGGKRIAAVLHGERGDTLLLHNPDENEASLSVLAQAEHRIRFAFVPGGGAGGLLAALDGGVPRKQPGVIYNKPIEGPLAAGQLPAGLTQQQAGQVVQLLQLNRILLTKPEAYEGPPQLRPPLDPDAHLLALFDSEGVAKGVLALPFAPEDVAVSPDGRSAVLSVELGSQPGLYLVTLGDTPALKRIYDQAARHPAWSPDSKQIAFAHDRDVFTLPADGGTAKNLTGGKGSNDSPVWSPAVAKK